MWKQRSVTLRPTGAAPWFLSSSAPWAQRCQAHFCEIASFIPLSIFFSRFYIFMACLPPSLISLKPQLLIQAFRSFQNTESDSCITVSFLIYQVLTAVLQVLLPQYVPQTQFKVSHFHIRPHCISSTVFSLAAP